VVVAAVVAAVVVAEPLYSCSRLVSSLLACKQVDALPIDETADLGGENARLFVDNPSARAAIDGTDTRMAVECR